MEIKSAEIYFSKFQNIRQIESLMNEFLPNHFLYHYSEEIDKESNSRHFLVVASTDLSLSETEVEAWVDNIFNNFKDHDVVVKRVNFFG